MTWLHWLEEGGGLRVKMDFQTKDLSKGGGGVNTEGGLNKFFTVVFAAWALNQSNVIVSLVKRSR